MATEQPDVVPLCIAVELLDISTEAIRKRIQHGTPLERKFDGVWYVEAPELPSSGGPDSPAGQPDAADYPSGPQNDEGQTSGRTPSGPSPDIAPLAVLIANLSRENQELAATASVWQYRALDRRACRRVAGRTDRWRHRPGRARGDPGRKTSHGGGGLAGGSTGRRRRRSARASTASSGAVDFPFRFVSPKEVSVCR